MIAQCRLSKKSCPRCGKGHHEALCNQLSPVTSASINTCSVVVLQTAAVWLAGEHGKTVVRCLFDNGSQAIFIRTSQASKVGARKVTERSIRLQAFGSSSSKAVLYPVFEFQLQGLSGGEIVTIQALVVDNLCGAHPVVSDPRISARVKSLKLTLADSAQVESSEIDLLIGSDAYWKLVSGQVLRLDESMAAVETKFGWVLSGALIRCKDQVDNSTSVGFIGLDQQLSKFWELEHIGITEAKQLVQSPVLTQFLLTTERLPNGRYSVRLPFKQDCGLLASNWEEAYRRFLQTTRWLSRQEALRLRYQEAIAEYVSNNHVEEVPIDSPCGTPEYYLPHHAVIREERVTSKVRIVFDASSHSPGCLSLNDCLHAGPSLIPEVAELLLRFRCYHVPFIGDIAKAFLQIALSLLDRDAVRFLWVKDEFWNLDWSEQSVESHLKILRKKVVLFGAASSPFLLAATIRKHAEDYQDQFSEASKFLDRNLYVDDLLAGGDSVQEAFDLNRACKGILADAKMDMRKWSTSSPELHALWIQSGEEVAKTDFPCGGDSSKVLGLWWRQCDDHFLFKIRLAEHQSLTKRHILSQVSAVFDSLGFLAPFTVRAKLLLQDIWMAGHNWDEVVMTCHPNILKKKLWDEVVNVQQQQDWLDWVRECRFVEAIKVNRWIGFFSTSSSYQCSFHMYSDASERAYGAVVYLRMGELTESGSVHFLMAKVRVAPIKKVTLPRMELLAALVGARLLNYCRQSIEFLSSSKQYCWTDSAIVCHWLSKHASNWKCFVANRVQEIHNLTRIQEWHHISGKENPADDFTRGKTASDLVDRKGWWEGPVWLAQSKEDWPEDKIFPEVEIDKEEKLVILVAIVEDVMNSTKFSTLSWLTRVGAWIRRFRDRRATGPLTSQDLKQAEEMIVRFVQRQEFSKEIADLEQGESVDSCSALHSLQPFLDNGLLRLGGRLQKSHLPFCLRHPVILPRGGHFVNLVILDIHNRLFHSGPQDTLVGVRNRFWVLQGCRAVRRALANCMICKRFRAQPMRVSQAPLPEGRVTESGLFTLTGVDFAGPLWILSADRSVSSKCYFCLFTCAVTRAVHVEIVSSMTVESFLLCIRRFFARFGVCQKIWSDNAKTFCAAGKELRGFWTVISDPLTNRFLVDRGVIWQFIVERASWWGGFWERLVRSVKERVRRTVHRSLLTFEELSTVLLEISAAINSRPLCYMSEDPRDPPVLTPGHFVNGGQPLFHPHPCDPSTRSTQQGVLQRWRHRRQLVIFFWTRWRQEYLMQLRAYHVRNNQGSSPAAEVGQIVLLIKDKVNRGEWPLARIMETFPGRDGRIRSCAIKLGNGAIVRRAVQHLCLLEL